MPESSLARPGSQALSLNDARQPASATVTVSGPTPTVDSEPESTSRGPDLEPGRGNYDRDGQLETDRDPARVPPAALGSVCQSHGRGSTQ